MQRITSSFAAALLALSLTPGVHAQESDDALRRDVEALKQGQEQIQKQLTEIKQLLAARPAAAPARPAGPDVEGKVFDLANNPVEGKPSARLTLVDFTDYQ